MGNVISFSADIFTIIASSIAIDIFLFKRKTIKSIISLLLNYSMQMSLNDLKSKIEKMNDYSMEDDDGKKEIINLLHDIEGQIIGNKVLNNSFNKVLVPSPHEFTFFHI